jgi:hypothetical protein
MGQQEKGQKLLTQIELKFFEITAKYAIFDYKRKEEIFEDLKAAPFDGKLRRYKSHWLRHVTRMNKNRMQKVMLNCRPNERR